MRVSAENPQSYPARRHEDEHNSWFDKNLITVALARVASCAG